MCNAPPFAQPPAQRHAGPLPLHDFRASAFPAKLTRNQALVLDVMRAAPGRALAAYEVLASLKPRGVKGPQSVYRALQALVQAGLVHRSESLNAFAPCTHQHPDAGGTNVEAVHQHRPAFLVCRHCRAVEEIADAGLPGLGVPLARRGFRVEGRVLELVGACLACDSATRVEARS
jgi:Fur family zinc uptake transcriptional regulator